MARGYGQTATSACGAAPVVAANSRPNIFTEQQEQWLGDATADYIEHMYTPVNDPSLSKYLQSIVDKLVATLPASSIKYRVLLVDSSTLNAYSIAGGHIYVLRKLAAVTRNEDEIASVIGHEIGHIASHQFAFEATADLKRLLGVTSVGDRADIFAKFQQLQEARLKDKHPPKPDDDTKQDEADKIGVYATAAAGYRPLGLAEFWDHAFFVNGETSDRISDFFGTTKPDQKRLRGMRQMAAALPPGCGGTTLNVSEAFLSWHAKVVANQAVVTEAATVANKEVSLYPPLRMDLDRLRFSRDGKSILAQDEGSVFVLSREPYTFQFRFDADDAMDAAFSPDSKRIVFSTPGLHTEEWSVDDKKLIAAQEILVQDKCRFSRISPDGKTLICITQDADSGKLNLALHDVATGNKVWEKARFSPGASEFYFGDWELAFWLPMYASFSADGNYLMIGTSESKMAFDLRTRTPIKIGGDLRKVREDYAFLGSDRVVGINAEDRSSSGIYTFPEGVLAQKVVIPRYLNELDSVSGPGASEFVLGYGFPGYGVALTTLPQGTMVGMKSRAMDVWNGTMIAEAADGSVALAKLGNTDPELEKRVMLPVSPLGLPRSVSLSNDGRYLALSSRSRGGVWDLSTGNRLFLLHGFTDSRWTDDGKLYADFPKVDKIERNIAELSVDTRVIKPLTYKVDEDANLHEGWLMEWKSGKEKGSSGVVPKTLLLHDPATDAVEWTKEFPDGKPAFTASRGRRDLIFSFGLKESAAKERMKAVPALAAEAAAVKNKDHARLIEVVDGAKGTTSAEAVVELPVALTTVEGFDRVGDLLFAGGEDGRTLVYSLTDGKQIRQMFGRVVSIDPESHRVCVRNRMDEAVVFDGDGNEVAHFHLGSPVRFAELRAKGTELIVLTADQKVRTMGVEATR